MVSLIYLFRDVCPQLRASVMVLEIRVGRYQRALICPIPTWLRRAVDSITVRLRAINWHQSVSDNALSWGFSLFHTSVYQVAWLIHPCSASLITTDTGEERRLTWILQFYNRLKIFRKYEFRYKTSWSKHPWPGFLPQSFQPPSSRPVESFTNFSLC